MDYWDKSVATNVSACACVCAHCSNTANTRATPLWLQLHQVANWNSRNLLTETQINQVRFCLPLNFICFHFCWFSLLSHSSQWKIIYNLLWTVLFFANVLLKFSAIVHRHGHSHSSTNLSAVERRQFSLHEFSRLKVIECIFCLQLWTDREHTTNSVRF